MKIRTLLFVLLAIHTLNSCKKGNVSSNNNEATSVQLTNTTLSLVVGGKERLLTIVEPVGATVSDAKWTSSNPDVATINEKGTVTALTAGQTTITLTPGNKSPEQCILNVIASPITDMIMPEIDSPIAKEAVIFIQGTGFQTGDKIWFQKISGSGLTLKSVQTADDILAQYREQAVNYISFYCSVNPGWYSVILEKENIQYELGNIQVAIPNIPEYVYDKNKIFWEDTHWRKFQLRGKVKEMQTTEEYHPYWTQKYFYTFNEKGYLKTAGITGSAPTTIYEYDNSNRLISKSEDCYWGGSNGCIDHVKLDYSYGDHKLYLPLDLSDEVCFAPFIYESFYGLDGAMYYQQRYNLEIWQKGLVGIKEEMHYTTGKTDTTNYQFLISDNNISTSSAKVMNALKKNFSWYYNGIMPYKGITTTTWSDGIGIDTYTYNFSSVGMPINSEHTYSNSTTIGSPIPLKFIENCPFSLFESYNDSQGSGEIFNCEYDKNWDILKYDDGILKVTFNYTSYDDYGNWVQCIALGKDVNGQSYINKLIRDITYW